MSVTALWTRRRSHGSRFGMGIYLPEDASLGVKQHLRKSRAARAIEAVATPYLVYEQDGVEDGLLLLYFPFAWDEGSPRVAVACTSGLSEAMQSQAREWCFARFELAIAFYSPGFSEALLERFLALGREVRHWMSDPSDPAFGLGDLIKHFPLIAGKQSALLIPPTPELVQAGLRPYDSMPSALEIRDWCDPGALLRAGQFGFLQAVPIHESEYAYAAARSDGFQFFLEHLLASDAEVELGHDSAFKILDMDRPAAL